MAALHAFLDLEPVLDSPARGLDDPRSLPGAAVGATAGKGAVPAPWAWPVLKAQQQQQHPLLKGQQQQQQQQPLKKQRRQLQLDEFSESDAETCSTSPGCSTASGEVGAACAGIGASLLDLEDDACSGSAAAAPAVAAAQQQQRRPAAQQMALPGGEALVAATFLDDVCARGSIYRYCVQRRQ